MAKWTTLLVVVMAMTMAMAIIWTTESTAAEINSKKGRPTREELAARWVAAPNAFVAGRGGEPGMRKLMGVKSTKRLHELPPMVEHPAHVIASLPANFTWRTTPYKGPIRNQGDCGSCWAFGAVESLTDRFNIASKNAAKFSLSALDVVTCDDNDNGCDGGDPGDAMDYMMQVGCVTHECAPYLVQDGGPIPTCAPADQPCLNFVNTPNCPTQCKNGTSFQGAKKFASNAYSVSSDPAQIQAEIYTNGPVEAAFSVYADFVHYKSGVYVHRSGSMLGGHAVEMVGWGVTEDGTPYWEIANSWTTTWGNNGYFWILRGQDECGIEDDVVAAAPAWP